MLSFNPTTRSNAAGRWVRVGQGEMAYEAFVPAPLPPDVALSKDVVLLLSDADRALGELSGLARMLPNADLLINPFTRKEAVLSSRIEGTQATITDLYDYEADDASGRRPESQDLREIRNYMAALSYGLGRVETLPLSGRFIGELHARLMQGVRGQERSPGEYRTSQNWIGAPGCLLSEASYVPPPPPEMRDAMASFERYLHAETDPYPPLVKLGLIHAQFEMIHPFLDGNGRIGRLLITLLLVHWQVLPLPLLYLSAYFEENREAYYARLNAVGSDGDWAGWLRFFLAGVATQSRDATARAKRLQDLQGAWREAVTSARSSALLVKLVDFLFLSPIITVPRARALLGVTYPAAKANIDKLIQAGIVEPFGTQTYGRKYWAPEVLRAIEA
jgi:Fic family protein